MTSQTERLPASGFSGPAMAGAITALTYVTDPEVWPRFLAWAEGQGGGPVISGEPEATRVRVREEQIPHLMAGH